MPSDAPKDRVFADNHIKLDKEKGLRRPKNYNTCELKELDQNRNILQLNGSEKKSQIISNKNRL